jgi:hypothetical protein
MNKVFKQLLLSTILPLLYLAVALSPVGLLGCRNRGMFAIGIAVVSIIIAFLLSIFTLKNRMKGSPFNPVNLISTLILAMPAISILIIYYFE